MTALIPTWRRFTTVRLELLLDGLDDSTDAYDDVANELAARMINDNRIAQAFGHERNSFPS